MNPSTLPVCRFARTVIMLLVGLPITAHAQHQPLTGQMMGGQVAATAPLTSTPDTLPAAATPAVPTVPVAPPSPPPPPPPPPPPLAHSDDPQLGATTRYLLDLQVSGRQGGNRLPMLGDEGDASYRRYLKSFEHPIPEFYETAVDKSNSNSYQH